MSDHKCPFAAPLISGAFGCAHAHPITRRGGPDIGCDDEAESAGCAALFQRLKDAALPAFGVPDDPTQMPHSVLVKLQYGGLLGLQASLDGRDSEHVEDISTLVTRACQRWQDVAAIPAEGWSDRMTAFKVKRRRGKA